MTSTRFYSRSAIAAALFAGAILHATPASAQRVFVAAQGSDANPCTFALPCRTFQHAHDTVAAGGEIDVLDPAGYGALTIGKSISIQGHGFSGISVANGGTGITINASATDTVSLNGLLVEGSGVGANGIVLNSGGSLIVESCVIHNVTNRGISFSSAATTTQTLSISSSNVSNSLNGIVILLNGSGDVTAALDRVALHANHDAGLNAIGTLGTGTLSVGLTDSVVANSFLNGLLIQSAAGHSPARLALTRTTVSGNGIGAEAFGANATIRLTQSTLTANLTGYSATTGGVIFSYGDNAIDDNAGNSGTLTSTSKQ
jgi:hypothetical protein